MAIEFLDYIKSYYNYILNETVLNTDAGHMKEYIKSTMINSKELEEYKLMSQELWVL